MNFNNYYCSSCSRMHQVGLLWISSDYEIHAWLCCKSCDCDNKSIRPSVQTEVSRECKHFSHTISQSRCRSAEETVKGERTLGFYPANSCQMSNELIAAGEDGSNLKCKVIHYHLHIYRLKGFVETCYSLTQRLKTLTDFFCAKYSIWSHHTHPRLTSGPVTFCIEPFTSSSTRSIFLTWWFPHSSR